MSKNQKQQKYCNYTRLPSSKFILLFVNSTMRPSLNHSITFTTQPYMCLPKRILMEMVPGANRQGRPRKRWEDDIIAVMAAPSSRLIGMLRIGIDGLILFMEPMSFGTRCKDRYTAYVTEIDLIDAQYKDNDLSNIWPSHHSGMWEGVPCQGEGGTVKW